MTILFLQFVDVLLTVLYLAIIVRVLLSWFPKAANNAFGAVVFQITEPILAPIRRIVPRVGLFDFTPMIALLLLWLFRTLIFELVRASM